MCVRRHDNVLKHAPHTADVVMSGEWKRPYSREKAAFPASWVKQVSTTPTVCCNIEESLLTRYVTHRSHGGLGLMWVASSHIVHACLFSTCLWSSGRLSISCLSYSRPNLGTMHMTQSIWGLVVSIFAAGVVQAKFWPTASRVDNVHGDRHLIAKLPPVSTSTDTVSEPMAASVGGN